MTSVTERLTVVEVQAAARALLAGVYRPASWSLRAGDTPALVVGCQGGAGATTVALALATAAGPSRLIDLLGGVPVDNPSDAASGGFVFPRGEITLSGDEALAYTREGVAAGEFDPAHRRQLVLTGIVTRLLTGDAMLNPGTARAVLDQPLWSSTAASTTCG